MADAVGAELTIESGGHQLAAHLVRPSARPTSPPPAVVIAHAFPAGPRAVANDPVALRTLAVRVARELSWSAMTFTFAGVGRSTGTFSMESWVGDLIGATSYLLEVERANGVWLAGFGTGGALCICAGASEPGVRGVISLGAPADFDDWARNPRQLIDFAAAGGIRRPIGEAGEPARLARQLRDISAVRSASGLAPRPLLVLHGSDDEAVPAFDARAIADAHGSAELRILPGASHYLRSDPRAVAIAFGWLERQRALGD